MSYNFKMFIIVILFVLINNPILSQSIDKLSSTVAFLSTKLPNNKISYGTGFFVGSDNALFLITAEHVSKTLSINSDITIRKNVDLPFTLKFSEIVNTKNKLSWSMILVV